MAMLWTTLFSSTCAVCRTCKNVLFIDTVCVFPRSELFEERKKAAHDEMLGSVRYELKQKYHKFLQSPPPPEISEARPSYSAAFSSFRTNTWRECLATIFTPLDPARQDVDWPTRFVDYVI